MIPRIIHLIWFGEQTSDVADALRRHRKLNPGHDVILHTTAEHLNPKYERLFSEVTLPQLRSDLLRWSLLEKFGGWYFDIDIVPRVSVMDAEGMYGLDGSLMLLTERGAFPNDDIIAVGEYWPHWDRIHQYFDCFRIGRDAAGNQAVQYSCFSLDCIIVAIIGRDGQDDQRWMLGQRSVLAA